MNKRRLIEEKQKLNLTGSSLIFFKPTNCFRLFLMNMITNSIFELTILATVLLSAVCMVLEHPLSDHNSDLNYYLQQINLGITLIFLVEMVIKIIVFGFLFNGPDSYLRGGWNILDSVIVMVSVVGIYLENVSKKGDHDYSDAAQNLELMKMLRVLRSMRLISRS